MGSLNFFLYVSKFSTLNMHLFFSKNTCTINVTKRILKKVTKGNSLLVQVVKHFHSGRPGFSRWLGN